MAAGANPSYYRKLALALGIGIIVAIVLGLTGVTGPGLLELEASVVTLFIAAFVIVAILLFFLLRVGDIFSIEDKLRDMLTAEGNKWSEALAAEERKAEELRNQLRRDAAKTNQDVLKETASQRMRIDEAQSAATRAASDASGALAQIAELRRRPETSTDVVALGTKLSLTDKELAELKRRDNVNSPLLKELQAQVQALQAESKKMSSRLAQALDNAEHREMEYSAARTGLEQQVNDLQRREQTLVIKQRDLETKNTELADAARKPRIAIKEGDESHHVLLLEGIGTKFAARLNAIGIITIPQLVEANARTLADELRIETPLVEEWQSMGRLLPLSGIGPQAAEILAKAGIRSPQMLAAQDPLDLSLKVKGLDAGKKVKMTGIDATPAVTKKWIDAARSGKVDAT